MIGQEAQTPWHQDEYIPQEIQYVMDGALPDCSKSAYITK